MWAMGKKINNNSALHWIRMSIFLFLSIIVPFSAILVPTLGKKCPVTVPTVSYVSTCPSNETEWKLAAQQKQCNTLAKLQNCTEPKKFVYHCVLNEDGTKYVEACAQVWFMSGYCARFRIADERIVNDPLLDCTKFSTPCPARFQSNESFKYQECYASLQQSTDSKNKQNQRHMTEREFVLVIFLCIFVTTTVLLVIALVFLSKKKLHEWRNKRKQTPDILHIPCEAENLPDDDKGTGEEPPHVPESEEEKEKPTRNEENQELSEDTNNQNGNEENREPSKDSNNQNGNFTATTDIDAVDQQMSFRTLSGIEGQCSVKNVTTISDLRDELSEKLSKKRDHVWVVQEENGIIYNDDTEFKELKKHQSQIEVMIGNDRGPVCVEYRSTEAEIDVISNKFSASQKYRMSCNHFTEPENLYIYAKDKITAGHSEVKCPKCMTSWKMEELLQKSHMSPDEQLFFGKAMSVNKKTKEKFGMFSPNYHGFISLPVISTDEFKLFYAK